MRALLFFVTLLVAQQWLFAQEKAELKPDSTKKKWTPNPNRAAALSAILPGLGQAYNKSYWKMPIIYAAIGGTVYGIISNQKNLETISAVYKRRINKDSSGNLMPELGSNESVLYTLNYYRRWRDLSAILLTATYVLNIIEAHVDAHLSEFDVSEDLSMRISPEILIADNRRAIPGLSLQLKVKNNVKKPILALE